MKLRLVTITLLMLTGMLQPATAATTNMPSASASANDQCHALMTEKECAAFLSAMSTLPQGLERERFLRTHLETKLEREKLCNKKFFVQPVVYYPRVSQAMLSY